MTSNQGRRTYRNLIDTTEPAWPLVEAWFANAKVPVEVLKASSISAEAALTELQVTTRSPMGAIVHETGGVLVDNRWLRLLGSGSPKLTRSMPGWTRERTSTEVGDSSSYLLVADDVLGGAFAVNGGGLSGRLGHVFYLAPDTLEWEDLELSYTDFLAWCVSESLSPFYDSLRWPGWESEVRHVGGDEALLIYPFPWVEGPSFAERVRRPVPVRELCALQEQFIG